MSLLPITPEGLTKIDQRVLVVTSDTNPSRVELYRDMTGVKRLALRSFRLSLPNFNAPLPTFLYLKAITSSSPSGENIVRNANAPFNLPNDVYPIHFRPNPTIFTGALAQYPVLWGFQDAFTNFKMIVPGNLTVFDLELYNETGALVVFPAGARIEYVFSIENIPTLSTSSNTHTVAGIRRHNDYLDA